MGWVRCVPVFADGEGGELLGLLVYVVREAMVKCCGVAVAMPRGYSRVPTSSIDQSVNTGTFPVLPVDHAASVVVSGLGTPSAERAG